MKKLVKLLGLATMLTAMLGLSACSTTETASDDFGPKHKLVIQVSSKDPLTQKIALNVAVNLQKAYGVDNVAIEVVAFGPGLGIMTAKGKQAKRVASLAVQGITFHACGNTMKKIVKKKGKAPKLVAGVLVVEAGAKRIIDLQEQGYAYIKP